MTALFEQYRPADWSQVVGQSKALARINAIRRRGLAGRAYWLTGQSGTGKTTIALLLAGEVADEFCIDEIDASGLTPAGVRDIERSLAYRGLGQGGRAVIINEKLPNDALYQEVHKPEGYGLNTLGHIRHVSGEPVFPLPPMHYPWTETHAALMALRNSEAEGDPYDGLQLIFTSPVDGGPTLPTMAWQVQLMYPRQKTLAHRHNSTTFYHAFEGEGVTVIEGERLEWHRGDVFAVPAWKWHQHENTVDGDAILFSIDEWPAMTKLGFYMKEEADA